MLFRFCSGSLPSTGSGKEVKELLNLNFCPQGLILTKKLRIFVLLSKSLVICRERKPKLSRVAGSSFPFFVLLTYGSFMVELFWLIFIQLNNEKNKYLSSLLLIFANNLFVFFLYLLVVCFISLWLSSSCKMLTILYHICLFVNFVRGKFVYVA